MIEVVLSEQGISTYLEGITAIEPHVFPSQSEMVEPSDNAEPEVPNLVGIWRGVDVLADTPHERTINLSQDGKNLSGLEIVTYLKDATPTVVQQTLSGVIEGHNVNLRGVNYTYVQKGLESEYVLDSYRLILSEDLNKMTGASLDADGSANDDFVLSRTPPLS